MDEPQRYYVKWKKQDIKHDVPHDSIHMKYQKANVQRWKVNDEG